MVGDIGQQQCHNCTKNIKKNLWKREREESHFWDCGWPMSLITISPKWYPTCLAHEEIVNKLLKHIGMNI